MRSLCLLALVAAACGRAPLSPTDGDLVPASTVGRDVVEGWEIEGDLFVSPILAAPTGATRVALIARVVEGADVSFFARSVDGDWLKTEMTWRDAELDDRFVARADLDEVATQVQLGVARADIAKLRSITFEAVVPM